MKRFAVILLLTMLTILGVAVAQETRATLSGSVADQTGAAIAGAKVTAIEVRTGVKTPTVTDATGRYNVPFLAPGQYEVLAEMQGFKSFLRKGITLGASDHVDIDIRMEIGQVSESVEVTADAPMLETTNASTGQSISTKQIEDMPLNGRNPMVAVQLAMGVVATGNPSGQISPMGNAAASAWSIGGTPAQTSEIMIDGAPNATWDNRIAYAPPQEAVQEVKVKAFDGDASFGHTGGGTINKVMKTGTNTLHGSGYYFMQPSALAANNFFANRQGVPVQDSKFNQWGFTGGGPVVLPQLYNGKNKLFWFFAYEKISGSQPINKYLTVPTDGERQGDFSALMGLPGATDCVAGANGATKTGFNCYQIFNPYTGVTKTSGTTNYTQRAPFYCDAAGNPSAPNLAPGFGNAGYGIQPAGTPCNKLPSQLMNPIAMAYLKYYLPPNLNVSGTGYSNFQNNTPTTDNYDNQLGRLDWVMSDRSRLSGNVRRTGYLQSKNDYFNNGAAGLASFLTRDNWGGTLDEVYTLNTTTVLNVRANFTKMSETHPSPMAGFDPTSIGFPSYMVSNSTFVQLPKIQFGSSCGGDSSQPASFDCLGPSAADILPSQSYSLFGTVVKQWNAHTLKWGVDARRYILDNQTYGNSTGKFTFGGGPTGGNGWTQYTSNGSPSPFGQDFASFLLGLPTNSSFDINGRGTYVSNYYALFLQDDWRVKPNLTINFGLRYDQDNPYYEKLGRTVNGFAFNTPNPLNDLAVTAYNASTKSKMPATINGVASPTAFAVPGGLTFATPNDKNVYDITSHLVSPRVGFAWSPDLLKGKTVIRGGFGLFVQPIAMSFLSPAGKYSSSPVITQEGFSQSTSVGTPSGMLLPATNLSNPFPTGILQPVGSSAGLTTFVGQGIDILNPKMKNPYSERWTFGFQHELSKNTVLEVSYIGNHAVHLPIANTQMNGVPRQYLSTKPYRDTALITALQTTVPNPFQGLIPNVSSFNGKTISVAQLLAPYPQYPVVDSTNFSGGVYLHNANTGSSNFNSLNVRLEKRLTSGLQIVGVYAWSKLIESDTYLNNTDTTPERRISPFDRPQRFVFATNYDLPIGRGKLINLENDWVNRFAGGWRVNGIYTWQSGAPLQWMNSTGSTTNIADYALCAVATVNGACPAGQEATSFDPKSLHYDPRGVDGKAFDVSHFVTASTGQLQYHLRTIPTTFSSLRTNNTNNVDASILKKFDITERAYFQFRVEAFNLFNRAQFDAVSLNATTMTATSGFGSITTQFNRSRQIQFGFRAVF